MTSLRHQLPAGTDALRQSFDALYRGEIFLLEPTAASLRAATEARQLLEDELGVSDVRAAHRELDEVELFSRIGRVRRELFLGERWHEHVRSMIDELGAPLGLDRSLVAFDPIRMRVVTHRGHDNPRAKTVYVPHRDTWYAHSQAVITWWVPLDDLAAEETFWLFPDAFDAPLANDSEIFEYSTWIRDGWDLKIGWQDRDAGLTTRYPGVVGEPEAGAALGFSCRRGQNLLFSGSHFHQTRPQSLDRTRYSLDFRVVLLGDHHRGAGAPNVDNRSRGSAAIDYVGYREAGA